jgi:nicotinamide mononucleotide transporter
MNVIEQWLGLFVQQIKDTPYLEWIGVSFGVIEVFLARANKVWLYPAGLASICITIYVMFHAGLFAECLLNSYYFVMSVYGWWLWRHRSTTQSLKITFATPRDWKIVGFIVLGGFVVLYAVLSTCTPSTVPIWDSAVSCTAWAGMWLLANRKVENWILLNISNILAIPLLFHKDLALYATLTTFLFVVAIQGYFGWKKRAELHTISSI